MNRHSTNTLSFPRRRESRCPYRPQTHTWIPAFAGMTNQVKLALLALTLVLVACSKDVPLEPAQPLKASTEQLATIPNLTPGPHKVLKGEPVQWQIGGQDLRLRIVQPEGTGPFPLVIFSHGNWSDITKYDALLEHWASHGYLILVPYHADGGGMARGIFNSLRKGNEGLIAARVADVKLLLDHLAEVDALEAGLAARIDRSRIAVAGHSFGAFTAQQMIGAAAVNPETGARVEGRDARVRAVMAISPPGPMFKIINEQSWLNVDAPMLVTTGTWDVNKQFWPDWREHTLSFNTAKPGLNWLLVVQGADHYLGNLICRPEREQPPQPDALRMVNATAVAFLNAHLRDDLGARAWLDAATLENLTDGFARLSHR